MTESYELAMYFMARHTAMDCLDKRGRRGYLFLIGDELAYPKVKAREIAKVMVVMFWPKTTSSRSQWKKSAMAARAEAIIASLARLVAKAPQVLAFAVRK